MLCATTSGCARPITGSALAITSSQRGEPGGGGAGGGGGGFGGGPGGPGLPRTMPQLLLFLACGELRSALSRHVVVAG